MLIRIASHEVSLEEPEDFNSFAVRLDECTIEPPSGWRSEGGTHVYIPPEDIRRLAGNLKDDPIWNQKLKSMIAFAAKHGWVNEHGAIRAHIISG